MEQLKTFATQVVLSLADKDETNESKKRRAVALLHEKAKSLGLAVSEQDIDKAVEEAYTNEHS
ncbi:phage holin, LLH family [uncultured Lacticaseibacillus sp.]|uniref:phage holin, LLH family n=1 Tax=uncultured Lacticaseibacillus sp. TaxID=2775882 RepID=UPI00258CAEC4|nr:phage holin, LLH family [uncultured Lacticaseibacillus sp.]